MCRLRWDHLRMRSIGRTSARPAPNRCRLSRPSAVTTKTLIYFHCLSTHYQAPALVRLFSVGASLIDQRDQNPDTTWIELDTGGTQKAFGVDRNQSSEIGAPAQPSPLLILNDGTTNYGAFRNVGELGYAYRNATTSLDFRTGGSTDSPLLDLFTYNSAITRSGVVSLNSRQPAVLAAILKSALPTLTGTPITTSQATNCREQHC